MVPRTTGYLLGFPAIRCCRGILLLYLDKPIGASPRRDEDGTILVHTLHGSDWYIKKGGECSAGYGKWYFNPPQASIVYVIYDANLITLRGNSIKVPT